MLSTCTARRTARTIHCAVLAGLGVACLPGQTARATEPALPNQPVTIRAVAHAVETAVDGTSAIAEPAASALVGSAPGPADPAAPGNESPVSTAEPAVENENENEIEARPLGVPTPGRAATGTDVAEGESLFRAFDPRTAELPRVLGALAAVIGLILLLRVVLRRASGGLGGASRPSGVLEILARYPVARGQSLVLLKMGRRVLLLHQTTTGMTTLTEVAGADEVAALLGRLEAGAGSRDAGRFRAALRAYESEHARTPARTGPREEPARLGPGAEIEIVDLTRSRGRGLLGRKPLATARGRT